MRVRRKRKMNSSLRTFQIPLWLKCAITAAVTVIVIGCGDSPADAPALVASGDRHFAKGEYREAVIEYRNAVQADQTLGDARAKLAATYEKLGDGANALEEYIR